jgi:ribose 5-phosphate isomerase B
VKIALSTDHAGMDRLQELKEFLGSLGHECLDFGPKTFEATDDYPDYIRPAAEAVASGEAEMGIIMGGSGQGEAMVANKVPGVRCALYYGIALPVGAIDANGTSANDEYEIIRLSREHNDANMLSIAARFVSKPETEKVVQMWLETPFGAVDRHVRRIAKIDLEKP